MDSLINVGHEDAPYITQISDDICSTLDNVTANGGADATPLVSTFPDSSSCISNNAGITSCKGGVAVGRETTYTNNNETSEIINIS